MATLDYDVIWNGATKRLLLSDRPTVVDPRWREWAFDAKGFAALRRAKAPTAARGTGATAAPGRPRRRVAAR
jgi:hypothetical protein